MKLQSFKPNGSFSSPRSRTSRPSSATGRKGLRRSPAVGGPLLLGVAVLPERLERAEDFIGTAMEQLVMSPLEILLRLHATDLPLTNRTIRSEPSGQLLNMSNSGLGSVKSDASREVCDQEAKNLVSSPAFVRTARMKVVSPLYPFLVFNLTDHHGPPTAVTAR